MGSFRECLKVVAFTMRYNGEELSAEDNTERRGYPPCETPRVYELTPINDKNADAFGVRKVERNLCAYDGPSGLRHNYVSLSCVRFDTDLGVT